MAGRIHQHCCSTQLVVLDVFVPEPASRLRCLLALAGGCVAGVPHTHAAVGDAQEIVGAAHPRVADPDDCTERVAIRRVRVAHPVARGVEVRGC